MSSSLSPFRVTLIGKRPFVSKKFKKIDTDKRIHSNIETIIFEEIEEENDGEGGQAFGIDFSSTVSNNH